MINKATSWQQDLARRAVDHVPDTAKNGIVSFGRFVARVCVRRKLHLDIFERGEGEQVRVVRFGEVAGMLGEVRALRAGDAKWAFDEDAGVVAEVANGEPHRCRRTGRVPELGL